MLEAIEKLLILQDRDHKVLRVKTELESVDPERRRLQTRVQEAQAALEAGKHKVNHLESERKKLELEVESFQERIQKYSVQQFQTKKNDEYRALTHEIQTCKENIKKLEDQQLEFMEQADAAQNEAAAAHRQFAETKKLVESQMADLATKEQRLQKQLADLQTDYDQLVTAVDATVLARYQRLRKHKGERIVVGIEHSVCGGCHMKLPTHVVIACQAEQELNCCPNCGRILYFTPHMDLAVAE